MRSYYVYILASRTRRLYVGATNDPLRRLQQHRDGEGSMFTRRFRITRLVFIEATSRVRDAIDREKQIKSWTRVKKLALIASANPTFRVLAEELVEGPASHETAPPSSFRSRFSIAKRRIGFDTPRAGDSSLRSE